MVINIENYLLTFPKVKLLTASFGNYNWPAPSSIRADHVNVLEPTDEEQTQDSDEEKSGEENILGVVAEVLHCRPLREANQRFRAREGRDQPGVQTKS